MIEARVRFKDSAGAGLIVHLIHTWHREDFPNGPIMSASSGPKDYLKNDICALMDRDPSIDAVYFVRAGGPPFLLVRKGLAYYDVTGREVEVAQRKPAALNSMSAGRTKGVAS